MTSRRDFLKKAGLISAAFAVPALNVNGKYHTIQDTFKEYQDCSG